MTQRWIDANAIDLDDEVFNAVLNTLNYYTEYLKMLLEDYQIRAENYE